MHGRARSPIVVLVLVLGSGCQPEVELDVILVDECGAAVAFQETRSIRVSLIGEAGFDEDLELSGCVRQSRCLTGKELQTVQDFTSLHAAIKQQGTLLTAAPGPDQGLVISGFRAEDCQPDRQDTHPLTFCGYQIGAFPSEDAHLYVLLSCIVGESAQICWPSQFMSTCAP